MSKLNKLQKESKKITSVTWPLMLLGRACELSSAKDLKEDLTEYQYYVAIENFIAEKIKPL